MKTLVFLSRKYWLGNKVQLLQLCTVMILATAALACACLYGRSSLLAELEQSLDNSGNYDLSVYYPDEEIAAYLEEEDRFSESSRIYRIGGMAPASSGAEPVDVGYFENQLAEDMFHLPLKEGRYPKCAGELCADKRTLQAWGYSARTGQTIPLSLYDSDGTYLEDREYLVVGITELTGTSATLRTNYIDGWPPFGEAYPPLLYLSTEEGEALNREGGADFIFLGNVTPVETTIYLDPVYITDVFDDNDMWRELGEKFSGRIYLQQITGISRSETALYLTLRDNWITAHNGSHRPGYADNDAVIDSGEYLTMNFYNGVLIPCFTVLLILLTVCSVYSVLHLVLQKRKQQFGILRSIGMSMRQMTVMLLMEMGVLLAACVGLGYLAGIGIYAGSLKLQEVLLNQRVYYAFSLDEFWGRYIRMVTYDPAVLPWAVVVTTMVVVLVVYFLKNLTASPLAMLQSERSEKRKKKRIRSIGTSLMGGSHAGLVFLLAIVITAVSFGYFSCRVQADKEARTYQDRLWEAGVDAYEYVANMYTYSNMCGTEQMLHDSGIASEAALSIAGDPAVEEYVLYAANLSTKLVYGPDNEKEAFLGGGAIRWSGSLEDPEGAYQSELDRIIWGARGYADTEKLYQTPTLGVSEETLSLFESYIVAGEIHPDRIATGEEVILIAKTHEVIDYFSVGELLPMTDVVFDPGLDGNEEILHGMMPEDIEPVAYIDGLAVYSLGERVSFYVQVGAIAVLDEEGQQLFYRSATRYDSGVRVVTTLEALQSYGLPDHNYTDLYINLKEDVDRTAFENQWYSMVAGSKNIRGYSLLDLREDLRAATRASMLIFYCLFVLLAVIGAVSVYNLVTVILYNARRKIAILRAVGGNRMTIRRMIYGKIIWYPVIACVLGAVVLYGYMGISWYAQVLNDIDALENPIVNEWYGRFPKLHFWKYDPHWFLLGVLFVVAAMLSVFVAKQLAALLKQDIPQELDRE